MFLARDLFRLMTNRKVDYNPEHFLLSMNDLRKKVGIPQLNNAEVTKEKDSISEEGVPRRYSWSSNF